MTYEELKERRSKLIMELARVNMQIHEMEDELHKEMRKQLSMLVRADPD